MKTEKRVQKDRIIETRAEADGKNYFVGWGSIFNQRSKLMMEGGRVFYEIIKPGAFDEVLRTKPDVKLNLNHDNDRLLARTSSGTLSLNVDEYGLQYRGLKADTSTANDAYKMVERGDYFESSFAFGVRNEDQVWEYDGEEKVWQRTIEKVSVLNDVSIVTDGAYANTDVTVAQRHLKEFEDKNLHKAERRKIEVELKLLELS